MSPSLFGNLVRIESLPSIQELHGYATQGRLSLVNAAGVSLRDIHPASALSPFELHEFVFSDLFSQRAIAEDLQAADAHEFLEAFTPNQQTQFRQAVQALTWHLVRFRSCVVFCHHGVGRSPAVALATLHTLWKIPIGEAAALVRTVRPQAHLSSLSSSAAAWMASQIQ